MRRYPSSYWCGFFVSLHVLVVSAQIKGHERVAGTLRIDLASPWLEAPSLNLVLTWMRLLGLKMNRGRHYCRNIGSTCSKPLPVEKQVTILFWPMVFLDAISCRRYRSFRRRVPYVLWCSASWDFGNHSWNKRHFARWKRSGMLHYWVSQSIKLPAQE